MTVGKAEEHVEIWIYIIISTARESFSKFHGV